MNNIKFPIAKDSEGNQLLTLFVGDPTQETVSHAEIVSPQKFMKELADLLREAAAK